MEGYPGRKIRALLIERGITVRQIVQKLGLQPATVSGVINRHRRSRRIEETIVEILGLPYEDLWGSPPRVRHTPLITPNGPSCQPKDDTNVQECAAKHPTDVGRN